MSLTFSYFFFLFNDTAAAVKEQNEEAYLIFHEYNFEIRSILRLMHKKLTITIFQKYYYITFDAIKP